MPRSWSHLLMLLSSMYTKLPLFRAEMEKLDIPNVDEFLELIVAGGGEIYACKLAADMFGIKKEDLHDDVKAIITVGDLYEMCDGPGTQIIFT